MKVSILGVDYLVTHLDYKDDPYFKKHDTVGYCDFYNKTIVICKTATHPACDDHNDQIATSKMQKEILRHEIIHAFLYESGMNESSHICGAAWARNEEMIDFFAIQGPKIMKVWTDAGCL